MLQHRDIDKRKKNISKLKDIISALRSIAAVRYQQSHQPVSGLRQYRDVVEDSMSLLKEYWPRMEAEEEVVARSLVIVFCSEYGFVGGFNRPILKTVKLQADDADIALIGTRGTLLAAEYGIKPVWALPMSSDYMSVQKTTKEIANQVFSAVEKGVSSVELVYTELDDREGAKVVKRSLIPVELEAIHKRNRKRNLPLLNMPPDELLGYLTEEYLMTSISCTVMESLHAENHGRLNAMDQAHHNIEKKHEQLQHMSRQQWQEEITTELLDIITGFTAQKCF